MLDLKPMGVLLVLGVVGILILCLVPTIRGIVRSFRNRAWKTTAAMGIVAAGIVATSSWAILDLAPKGDRTIAQLKLSDGREFVVHHYRYGWLEYPKVRFYARDTNGVWTSFPVYAELVDSNATTLVLDASGRQVELLSGERRVNSYIIQHNSIVHVDGPGSIKWQLPPGIEPGEENLY